jgi:glycosyltransferase involved in cell wall biosynthesis
MKFSTVFAVMNEERYLPDALKSVQGCDDIVVVVDDRTTDRTAEFAALAGARVFTRKFDGYANQKNFAIDQAKNDWVLILDGDERVTPELLREIYNAEPLMPQVAAYKFAWRNYLGGRWLKHGGLYPDLHTRLIDRKRARYGQRQVHETLEINGEAERLDGDIIHLTYRNTRAYYDKVVKYAPLEAAWTKERPAVGAAVKEFLVRYIRLEGWKDGWAGLVSAVLLAYYKLVVRRNMPKAGAAGGQATK